MIKFVLKLDEPFKYKMFDVDSKCYGSEERKKSAKDHYKFINLEPDDAKEILSKYKSNIDFITANYDDFKEDDRYYLELNNKRPYIGRTFVIYPLVKNCIVLMPTSDKMHQYVKTFTTRMWTEVKKFNDFEF